MKTKKLIYLAIISGLFLSSGCSSEPDKPVPTTATANQSHKNADDEGGTSGPLWVTTHQISIPELSGHTEVGLPLKNPDGAWKRPTVFLSRESVYLNDTQMGDVQCVEGECQLVDPSIVSVLQSQVRKKEPVVLVVDKDVTASVLVPIVRAAGSKKRPVTYLVQGDGDTVAGIVIEPGAPPLRPGVPREIRDALEGGPGADRYVSDRKTLRRAAPVAPGVQVRVTGGKLSVSERCGGNATSTKVRRNMRAYNACYRLARQRNDAAAGTIQVSWNISQEGKATQITSTSRDLQDPELHKCIKEAFGAMAFPPHSAPLEECHISWQIKMQKRDSNTPKEVRKERQLRLKIMIGQDGLQLIPSGEDKGKIVAKDDWDALKTQLGEWSASHKQLLVRADANIPSARLARIASLAKQAGFGRIFFAEKE